MKKYIVLFIALIILTSNACFAIQEAPNTVKMQVFSNDIENLPNNFFTSPMKPVKVENNNADDDKDSATSGSRKTNPPLKKFRLGIQKKRLEKANKNKPVEPQQVSQEPENDVILDCENMEYFAERNEMEATGGVSVYFPGANTTLKADKLVYNQTSNVIQATGNVIVIKEGNQLTGDYMQINMNEENSFMDNMQNESPKIRFRAKKGYMYGDKIIQEQGSMYITEKTILNLKTMMFGPDLDQMMVKELDRSSFKKDLKGGTFKIRADDIIVNSKDEHDTVVLKKAQIFYNDKKIGTFPTMSFHTNKAQDYVEGNYPEFGSKTEFGTFLGPGFVFDTPRGTTLKVLPILNYKGDKLGFGGMAKFKSATNYTDVAYGTANNVFYLRGRQELDDNIFIQYASNAYMNDWFLGLRMPKYGAEIVYDEQFAKNDFIAKGLPMTFRHRAAAGFMQDRGTGGHSDALAGSEGNIGTSRWKYMAEVYQSFYNYRDEEKLRAVDFGIALQGSATVYGTGDTQMIGRVGPRIHTQNKYWMQDIGYFLSAYDDRSPLPMFDKYMYGKSNLYFRESLRVHKLLTLSWFGSINLTDDSWNDKLMQECAFYATIGPDDIKFNLGYDVVRQQTYFNVVMHMDAKGSTIEYKRMEIKRPELLGKKDKDDNDLEAAPKAGRPGVLDRAEVTDVEEEVL